MREQRVVTFRKNQHLVALPATVRKHLGILAGALVYFHITQAGSVVLTTSGQATGGKPRLSRDCPQCAVYHRELDRLRGLGRHQQVADYNTAFGQGYERAQKDLPIWRLQWGALRAEIEGVRHELAHLRTLWPGRPRPVRPGRSRRLAFAGSVDALPSPPSPPPAVDLGGAETSGGEAPQVSH